VQSAKEREGAKRGGKSIRPSGLAAAVAAAERRARRAKAAAAMRASRLAGNGSPEEREMGRRARRAKRGKSIRPNGLAAAATAQQDAEGRSTKSRRRQRRSECLRAARGQRCGREREKQKPAGRGEQSGRSTSSAPSPSCASSSDGPCGRRRGLGKTSRWTRRSSGQPATDGAPRLTAASVPARVGSRGWLCRSVVRRRRTD